MGKMRFKSWSAAEEAERFASSQATILGEAITMIVEERGGWNWIKSGKFRALLIHPERAHGGIVVIRVGPNHLAYAYAEKWVSDTLKATPLAPDDYAYRHLAALVKHDLDKVNARLRDQAGVQKVPQGSDKFDGEFSRFE